MSVFLKMHGLGNDFVIFDGRVFPVPIDAGAARAIADRRRGIGCDQVIVMEKGTQNVGAFMRIFNADGGEVESCGNAARAVGLLIGKALRIETLGGLLAVDPSGSDVAVDMGEPRFEWDQVPLAYPVDTQVMPVAWELLEAPIASRARCATRWPRRCVRFTTRCRSPNT